MDMRLINTWFLRHNLDIDYNKSYCIVFTQDKRTQPNFSTIKIHDINCEINYTSACDVINKVD